MSANVNGYPEMNFGRRPFHFELPESFHPLEVPDNPFSSWLGRFEHAADVTRAVHQRLPLSEEVVQKAMDTELSERDTESVAVGLHALGVGF